MIVKIDGESTVRPYEQIKNQLRRKAENGSLPANTRLPAVRQLAEDLALAPGTVARAYRELEHEGVIVTRGRHGTFVTENARKVIDDREREALLEAAAENLAIVARQVGATAKETTAALRRAMGD